MRPARTPILCSRWVMSPPKNFFALVRTNADNYLIKFYVRKENLPVQKWNFMELREVLLAIRAKMNGVSLEQALKQQLVTPQEATLYQRFWTPIIVRRELTAEELTELQ